VNPPLALSGARGILLTEGCARLARAGQPRMSTGAPGGSSGQDRIVLSAAHQGLHRLAMFKKILIANRGEIAVRILRACREMGIASVAVYSDVDRASLHVRHADEAYAIGAAAAAESYLNIGKILEVARHSRAEAIHPGYGFLSENAHFAQACADAGVKFIGPTPAAMEMMGSKTRARQAMQAAGVPMVPGSSRGLEAAEAARLAADVGYPIMLKAAAGGGGKGMRLVRSAEELPSSFEAARSEAERAFGDGEVYVEKFIENPRHIEMQVLADECGNTVYLGERECSIQRRHQKVLEESPSPIVDPEMRRRMGEVAVRVAQAAGYTNAGTVEFLVDERKKFYFLEMNTRLQVEHPVTELITGLDLVHLQIRIACGERLSFAQEDVQVRGHAMECRIYAEDPDNNFFPSPGRITLLLAPAGPGIRRDSGMYEGWTVPIEYDPLLAKLIAYGSDRQQTVMRLRRALHEYFVGGIKTNIPLFRRILRDPEFAAGNIDTGFLERLLSRPESDPVRKEHGTVAAIAAGIFAVLEGPTEAQSGASATNGAGGMQGEGTTWKQAARREARR
jgi:acetyl-CoA carboxylase, biotin carboxylase subunit